MKFKRILATFIFIVCITNSVMVFAEDISISLNGEDMKYSIEPMLVNNRTLVPAEELLKHYNIPYEWNDISKEFTIKISDEENIKLIADDSVMFHNIKDETKEIILDSNMVIKDNVVFAPIRAVSESLGYTVDWYNEYNSVAVKTLKIVQGEHKLDNYVDYLNKSKDELKSNLKSFELYDDKLKPFYMYSGTDEAGNTYMFGFMDGIDKCCVVETGIENAFPGLTGIYESYESIDKENIEKYIGTETKLKVDNLYGYYLEYGYKDCSVRVLCNDDGSTGYIAGLYVTQNEPSFLDWVGREYPVNSASGS